MPTAKRLDDLVAALRTATPAKRAALLAKHAKLVMRGTHVRQPREPPRPPECQIPRPSRRTPVSTVTITVTEALLNARLAARPPPNSTLSTAS